MSALVACALTLEAQTLVPHCVPGKQPKGGKFAIALLNLAGFPHPSPPPVTDVTFEDFGPVSISTPLLRKLSPTSYLAVVPHTLSGTIAPFPRVITPVGSFACQGNVLVLPDYYDVVPLVTSFRTLRPSPFAGTQTGFVGDTVEFTGTFIDQVDYAMFNGVRSSVRRFYPPGWQPGMPYTRITTVVPPGATSGPLTLDTAGGVGFWRTPAGAPVPYTVMPAVRLPCVVPVCATDITSRVSITKVGTFRFNRYTRLFQQGVIIEWHPVS